MENSPFISPDPDSKPAISRTRFSTLIPRGTHRDRKTGTGQKTRPSHGNKPIIKPDMNRVAKKKDPDSDFGPAMQDRSGMRID